MNAQPKIIKLAAHFPGVSDSTCYYRGSAPYGDLVLKNNHMSMDIISDFQHFYGDLFNIVFLQRPFTPAHLEGMKIAKLNGLPVIIDYDDDLLSVDTSNPAWAHYGRQDVKETIKAIMYMADAITCTGSELARVIEVYNKNVHVIPNAIKDKFLDFHTTDYDHPKKPIVCWRGGSSHERDLLNHSGAIKSAISDFKEWSWVFRGFRSWQIMEGQDPERVKFEDWKPVAAYMREIISQEASLFVVPLDDNRFNHSKSPVAWLEASFAGAACLAPNWEAWRFPGVINYDNDADFQVKLNDCLSGKINLMDAARISWDYIQNNMLLSKVNGKRLEIIKSLI
jgi:hypothetical protein